MNFVQDENELSDSKYFLSRMKNLVHNYKIIPCNVRKQKWTFWSQTFFVLDKYDFVWANGLEKDWFQNQLLLH